MGDLKDMKVIDLGYVREPSGGKNISRLLPNIKIVYFVAHWYAPWTSLDDQSVGHLVQYELVNGMAIDQADICALFPGSIISDGGDKEYVVVVCCANREYRLDLVKQVQREED